MFDQASRGSYARSYAGLMPGGMWSYADQNGEEVLRIKLFNSPTASLVQSLVRSLLAKPCAP